MKTYTNSIDDLAKANRKSPVVFGEYLTKDGNEVRTNIDLRNSDRTLYRLKDGKEFVILWGDLKMALYRPIWDGVNHK